MPLTKGEFDTPFKPNTRVCQGDNIPQQQPKSNKVLLLSCFDQHINTGIELSSSKKIVSHVI